MENIMSQQSLENQQLSQVASKFAFPAALTGMMILGGWALHDGIRTEDRLKKNLSMVAFIGTAVFAGYTKMIAQSERNKKLGIWNTNITPQKFSIAAERHRELCNQATVEIVVTASMVASTPISMAVALTTITPPILAAGLVLSAVGLATERRKKSLNKELTEAARRIQEVPPGYANSNEKPYDLSDWQCFQLNRDLRQYKL
jgi:hypothetical protein